jgi:hypothetical protein
MPPLPKENGPDSPKRHRCSWLAICLLALLLAACSERSVPRPEIAPPAVMPGKPFPEKMPTLEERVVTLFTATPSLDAPLPPGPPATPYPVPTAYPPLPISQIAIELLPEKLTTALRIEPAGDLQRITGWSSGWRSEARPPCPSFVWMDEDRLLLFPTTGEFENFDYYPETLPVVVDLEQGSFWLPVEGGPTSTCLRAYWSAEHQVLTAFGEGETFLYDVKGKLTHRFRGGAASGVVSPSGRRVLTGSLLIDLEQKSAQSGVSVPGSWFGDIAWSPDETRVFRCCFGFFDFSTRTASEFTLGLLPEGRGCGLDGCISSTWISSDLVRVDWDFGFDGKDGFIDRPLINPVEQTYYDTLPANAPPGCEYGLRVFSPDNRFSSATCEGQIYWLDLQSEEIFASSAREEIGLWRWSPDSRYLLAAAAAAWQKQAAHYYVLPAAGGATVGVHSQAVFSPTWRGGALYFLTGDNRSLAAFQPESGPLQEIALPQPAQPSLYWLEAEGEAQVVILLGQDERTFILVNLEEGNTRSVALDQPVSQTVRWEKDTIRQEQGRLIWVSQDGLSLLSLDMRTGEVGENRFETPVYAVFSRPGSLETIAQGVDGSLWWAPDPALGRSELLGASLPDVRHVRWSPSGGQVAFISLADLLIARIPNE